MKARYFALVILLFALNPLYAQTYLKGSVVESGSNERIPNVFIHDVNSKEVALTDKKGNFEIKTGTGHTLIFTSPGYVSDTMYVISMDALRVRMKIQGIALNQVNITSTRAPFNPREEYADVYRKSKVYVLSPSSWLGREGRNARRLKRYFDREEQERHVDQVFSYAYVSSLVPLRGKDLENFMTLYRPSYAYVMNNNGPSLAVYINDSYKKFMALPPEKRIVPELKLP